MSTFRLEIITPERVMYDGMTEGIIVRTTVGDKGILARHEPYVAALGYGFVKVKLDGKYRLAAVSTGIVRVSKEKTTILADSCEWADEIDIERAKLAKEHAEQRLSNKSAEKRELDVAEYKLKRALNRIDTYNMNK